MKIRFLHISDLHLSHRENNEKEWSLEAFNQDIVIHSLLSSMRDLFLDKDFWVDFIIITGDIARSGKIEEYKVAESFCEKLLRLTRLSQKNIYVVPGNHDVDRSVVKDIHKSTLYSFNDQNQINELLNDYDFFEILIRKFKNYNFFAEKIMGDSIFHLSKYFFAKTLELKKQCSKVKVNLIGLNSAIFAGYDGDDEKSLALGLSQVDKTLRHIDKENCVNIAFFHHPFSCFHHSDKISANRLMEAVDLVLTGHLHEPDNAEIINSIGKTIMISAGASYETREKHNSFNFIEIDVTTGEGSVSFYKYLPKFNTWKIDTDINPNHENGCFCFNIRKKIVKPKKTSEVISESEKIKLLLLHSEKIVINETINRDILYEKLKKIIIDNKIKRVIFEYSCELGEFTCVKLNDLCGVLFELYNNFMCFDSDFQEKKISIGIDGVDQKSVSTYFGLHALPSTYVLELDGKMCKWK